MSTLRLPYEGEYAVSQYFGEKFFRDGIDVYAQYGLEGHNGLDFAIPTGVKVLAPHSGIIKEATYDPSGYGNYVKIENDEEGSILAHLDSIKVHVGYQLLAGEEIGISGNTGNSTGSHLHWGYYTLPRDRQTGFNGFIDHYPLVAKFFGSTVILPPETLYNVGDEIRPSEDIPTGASTSDITFEYGRVGKDAPAFITSIVSVGTELFYAIDQKHIGGGTGFVKVNEVDTTPIFSADTGPSTEVKQLEELRTALGALRDSRNKWRSDYKNLAAEYEKLESTLREYSDVMQPYDISTPEELTVALELIDSYSPTPDMEPSEVGEEPISIQDDGSKPSLNIDFNWLLEVLGLEVIEVER